MNEIDRIEKIDYVPTPKDILYCRKATKGVHEFTIRIEVCIVGRRSNYRFTIIHLIRFLFCLLVEHSFCIR